jgi:hypothetical protein
MTDPAGTVQARSPIVSDLLFVFEFAGSIIVIALPILLILRLLAGGGARGITDLFMVHGSDDDVAPVEEETPPRWRPELLTARRRTVAPEEAGAGSGARRSSVGGLESTVC